MWDTYATILLGASAPPPDSSPVMADGGGYDGGVF